MNPEVGTIREARFDDAEALGRSTSALGKPLTPPTSPKSSSMP
ncbi:MAG: hypothetical protein M0Z45_05905 [Actinomycetota bacterium]|nr:hypothetical protein [Actinomycetota bacterium]